MVVLVLTMTTPAIQQIDGTGLPRSLRWRLQMGMLERSSSVNNLRLLNHHNMRLTRERYSNLVAQYAPALKASREEQAVGKSVLVTAVEGDDDPLTAALKQREVLEKQDIVAMKDQETKSAQRRRSTLSTKARIRRRSDMLLLEVTEEEEEEVNPSDLSFVANSHSLPQTRKSTVASKSKCRRRADQLLHAANEAFTSTELLEAIQKDVRRLDQEHAQYYHSRVNFLRHEEGDEPQEYIESLLERNERLIQVLHTYSSHSGSYYQGMHEVCSYLMFVIEMDLFDLDTYPKEAFNELMEDEYLLHDTFVLFESLLGDALLSCFEDSMAMGNAIVQKIPYVAKDKKLYNHVQAMPLAHEVYTSRWVRLMFSREIESSRHVLQLWDFFFDLTTEDPAIVSAEAHEILNQQKDVLIELGKHTLVEVLEMTAASLIWLRREDLWKHKAETAVEVLINNVKLTDISELTHTLMASLHRMQANEHMAPLELPSPMHSDTTGLSALMKIPAMPKRLSMPVMRRFSQATPTTSVQNQSKEDRRYSLMINRERSIQELMDNGTPISNLLGESDEFESDEFSHDHGAFDQQSVDNDSISSTVAAMDDDASSSQVGTVSVVSTFRRFGQRRSNDTGTTTAPEVELGTELRVMGPDGEAKEVDETENESSSYGSDDVQNLGELSEQGGRDGNVDSDMAMCIGMSMAF